jgi:anti-anti-sigma factor
MDVNENQVVITDISRLVRVVAFSGSLDAAASAGLEQVLMAQLNNGYKQLVIDMTQVDHISSRGLRMLVAVWKRAQDMQGDLIIAALRPYLREVMSLIGFDLVFTILDTVDEAVSGTE